MKPEFVLKKVAGLPFRCSATALPATRCSTSPTSFPPPGTCSASVSPTAGSPPRSSPLRPAAQGVRTAAAAPEMLCIAEEAAQLWVAVCSEHGWVPRREFESWLSLMHEVELLRLPLAFGRAHADVTLSEGGAVATRGAAGGWSRTAASTVAMRSGRHFARFTVVEARSMMFFGVIRPGWAVEEGGDAYAQNGDCHCVIDTLNGRRYPGQYPGIGWEGRQPAGKPGDRIGMLLDLDQGSMTVWKNDVKLGVMVAEGLSRLSGPLCWAVSTQFASGGESARIESSPAPLSPTEEELAAAGTWQAAH